MVPRLACVGPYLQEPAVLRNRNPHLQFLLTCRSSKREPRVPKLGSVSYQRLGICSVSQWELMVPRLEHMGSNLWEPGKFPKWEPAVPTLGIISSRCLTPAMLRLRARRASKREPGAPLSKKQFLLAYFSCRISKCSYC